MLSRVAVSRWRSAAGFTLTEILVGLGLGLVTLATVTSFHRFQLLTIRRQATQNDLQMTARSVVDIFTRDIRRAGRNPRCDDEISAIADAKQSLVRVQSDLDGDGDAEGWDEDITYVFKSGMNGIDRVANGTTATLVDNVVLEGSLIRYFDQAGAEITAGSTGLAAGQRDAVQRIRLEIALRSTAPDPQTMLPTRASVANDVDLRNRHFINDIDCP